MEKCFTPSKWTPSMHLIICLEFGASVRQQIVARKLTVLAESMGCFALKPVRIVVENAQIACLPWLKRMVCRRCVILLYELDQHIHFPCSRWRPFWNFGILTLQIYCFSQINVRIRFLESNNIILASLHMCLYIILIDINHLQWSDITVAAILDFTYSVHIRCICL